MVRFPFDKCTVLPEKFDLEKIIRRKIDEGFDEEPLFICDVSDVLAKHKLWTECLPRVFPFFAVKCNDSPVMSQMLAALGTGFDCASKGEILNALSIGIPPESIIFAQTVKLTSHIQCASEKNVKWVTFDNETELFKIKNLYPTAELLLRFRCESKAFFRLGDKFGCDPVTTAPGLIQMAKSLGLNMIGIAVHVGSDCSDPPTFANAIAVARQLFDVGKKVGYDFTLLDIGGGFPGAKETNMAEIASAINESLSVHFPSPDVQVISEPGRFFVESAFTLVTRAHSKRKDYKNGKVDKIQYYVNDGVYGSFHAHANDREPAKPKILDQKRNTSTLYNCTIWGPTCSNADKIWDNVQLPDLEVDEVIYFENMGAYKYPMASKFNGFPLPKVEFYIEDKQLDELKAKLSEEKL